MIETIEWTPSGRFKEHILKLNLLERQGHKCADCEAPIKLGGPQNRQVGHLNKATNTLICTACRDGR